MKNIIKNISFNRKDVFDPIAYLISLYELHPLLNAKDIASVIWATKNY